MTTKPTRSHATNGVIAWNDLPHSAQMAAVRAAAVAIGAAPADRLPAIVAPVARFTSGKRARRGAVPLGKALADDAGFRALVAHELPDGFGASEGRAPAEVSEAAARAFLLQLPDSDEMLAAATHADDYAALQAQVAGLNDAIGVLTAKLAEATATHDEDAPGTPVAVRTAGAQSAADEAQLAKLRQRLRQQGTRVKAAEIAAEQAEDTMRRARDEADAEIASARRDAQKWRSAADAEARRAEAAQQALDRERDDAGQARADADRRIRLLLDTMTGAAAGLAREWNLTSGGAAPADVVARHLPAAHQPVARASDARTVREWLALPGAHLIIDGYNVTKTGYEHLSLAEQRDRLIRSLGPLAVRTGAEVTVVFDGADVVAAPASTRRVRVVFSPPDVIADDVIREMTDAEPVGRVVIVVTSDKAVVSAVRRSGARTVPSVVFLEALAG